MVTARGDDENFEVFKTPYRLFHHGIVETAEINHIHAAECYCALVHKPAGLAEIDVFGILRRFCLENRVERSVVVIMIEYLCDNQLERTRRRHPAALGHAGVHTGGEPASALSRTDEIFRNALYKRDGSAELRLPESEVVERYAKHRIVFGFHFDDAVVARSNRAERVDGDRCGKHFASVMVGVVAHYFDASG